MVEHWLLIVVPAFGRLKPPRFPLILMLVISNKIELGGDFLLFETEILEIILHINCHPMNGIRNW